MKDIKQIKQELLNFGMSHNACEEGLKSIKGDTLIELFANIGEYIYWCKDDKEKTKEFNNIFDNDLVIEDGVLLCNCSNLTIITIPNSVTSIEKYAFCNCKELISIKIPNSITSIGKSAFSDCSKLTSIEIPNSVTSIGKFAFEDCSNLISVEMSASVISIGKFAFKNCSKLTSIKIPNVTTSIGKDVFYGCKENLKIIRK